MTGDLRWTAHPLAENTWPRSALLGGIAMGVSLGAALSFGGAAYGLLALGVLGAALSPYFFPTHYLLDEKGVQIRHLGRRQQRPWSQFCRAEFHPGGIFLSPAARASRLDGFRGCFLRAPRDPEGARRFVQAHVAPAPH